MHASGDGESPRGSFIGYGWVWLAVFALCLPGARAAADEAWAPLARHLPPPGIALDDARRAELRAGLLRLQERLAQLPRATDDALRCDVEIFEKAVRMAVELDEFQRPDEIKAAAQLLEQAEKRLEELSAGQHSWTSQHGLVVAGHRSRVDGSVQPFGLRIPEKLDLQAGAAPLYVWLHGRDDKLTDLAFLVQRQKQPGQAQPEDAIVLHPFGRSCLGWKSTAEIDVLEAIEAVAARYRIDRNRIVLMGFSMGGAGAWHLGAHYADRWAAVHPGAGFVDVARYTRLAADAYPPRYEQWLWGVYDVPDYVRNLFNVPVVVAYSGENDKQKDAADMMAEAFLSEGHILDHRIGPGMGHKYHEQSWRDISALLHDAAQRGRPTMPRHVSLQTRTLRYPAMHWVEAQGLDQHWRDARIDADLSKNGTLTVTTANVRRMRLSPAGHVQTVTIDGQPVERRDGALSYEKIQQGWRLAETTADSSLAKRPGLQGPIDDAFLEPFLVVLPSGVSSSPAVQRWIDFEWRHFAARWQSVYRGSLRVKQDKDVEPSDLRQYHLIVWGEPETNLVLQRMAGQLPIRWSQQDVNVGDSRWDRAWHVPVAIYPNPLAPGKYVVLNSGPTHREGHDRTNSLQNPKLPDWAVIDIREAPNGLAPGKIVAADFFDEAWQLQQPSSPPIR